jgi:hypothetical protein
MTLFVGEQAQACGIQRQMLGCADRELDPSCRECRAELTVREEGHVPAQPAQTSEQPIGANGDIGR